MALTRSSTPETQTVQSSISTNTECGISPINTTADLLAVIQSVLSAQPVDLLASLQQLVAAHCILSTFAPQHVKQWFTEAEAVFKRIFFKFLTPPSVSSKSCAHSTWWPRPTCFIWWRPIFWLLQRFRWSQISCNCVTSPRTGHKKHFLGILCWKATTHRHSAVDWKDNRLSQLLHELQRVPPVSFFATVNQVRIWRRASVKNELSEKADIILVLKQHAFTSQMAKFHEKPQHSYSGGGGRSSERQHSLSNNSRDWKSTSPRWSYYWRPHERSMATPIPSRNQAHSNVVSGEKTRFVATTNAKVHLP